MPRSGPLVEAASGTGVKGTPRASLSVNSSPES